MALNKQKGQMYPFVSHTWNAIKGKCPHDCSYCYMKIYRQPELHFDEKELKTDLGHGNFIFVGSSCDMWAKGVPRPWITSVLSHCNFFKSQYLFQSKNPARFAFFPLGIPFESVLGTTIETNRYYTYSKAPQPQERFADFVRIKHHRKMISIEPIMDFDLEVLIPMIVAIKPEFVSIGADSKGHKLPEPPPGKVLHLLDALRAITTVKIKDNLKRLVSEEV